MPHLAATHLGFPEHYYRQDEVLAHMLTLYSNREAELPPSSIRKLFESVGVSGRYFARPLDYYLSPQGFGERNRTFIEVATDLGERVVRELLERVELPASDVQVLMTNTVTGVAVPSLDARLLNRLPFAASTRRVPLFGLGCVAGAAGLARAHDYLVGHPRDAVVFLTVELCSLTQQPGDSSLTNVIASGLFGDGAAAVLLVGDEHRLARGRPRIEATRSCLFPDTERVMGWDVVDSGLRIVLGKAVPELARTALPPAVHGFLHEQGWSLADVEHFVAHPGGPAVIDALESGLNLPEGALALTRECLARLGNLSSASVLSVLHEFQRSRRLVSGSRGLLFAMGPGFCAELVTFTC